MALLALDNPDNSGKDRNGRMGTELPKSDYRVLVQVQDDDSGV